LAKRCLELGANTAGFYRPVVRGGAYMRLEMMCLGRHWNPRTYRYEAARSDYDSLPVQELPADLRLLAQYAAALAGFQIAPDICLISHYSESGRLGVHQDKDERPETIEAGIPIVSISLGDTAEFRIGGLKRRDPLKKTVLESGDAVVMGGPSRLRFHGISRIHPCTSPAALGQSGRYNLSFRQY
jgi:DNA alkylation damage repair protein AlkB